MENIGKYQITGELGSGGFGRVYKAFDPTVGRVVAIKVLSVQDDPSLIIRFEAEAKTSANLQHKNIVIVHEFGEQIIDERTKKQFLVMEYLSGKNLQEILNERIAIPPLEKLIIMSEVAQGLQFAHEHGVVHRDVKPANIMRLSDGSVKIMDFGIARLMRGANTRLTQAGIMIGTPQYMAPEQFTTDTADEKCDVWAYGVVFYEFLSGVNPFHGDNAPQMIFRVTSEDPPPISSALPGLPRSLDPILKRLLAKNRDDRYATLEDLRFDLDPVIGELKRAQVDDDKKIVFRLIAEERLDEALAVVRRILEMDQTDSQAREWRRQLPGKIKQQNLQLRIRSLAEQAESDFGRRDLPAAVDKLAEAVRLDASNQLVRSRLDEILAEQTRVKNAQAELSAARTALERNALTSAFERAKEAERLDPLNPEAHDLAERIRREMARREAEAQRKEGLNKAKGLILVQSYENALSVLKELETRFPGDAEIKEKLEEAKRLEAAYAAQKKIDATILEIRDLMRKEQYQRAIDLLEALDKDIPQKDQVAELLSYARERLEAETRARRVEEILRQALGAGSGDFESGLQLVDQALDLDPANEKALRIRQKLLAIRQTDQENRAIQRLVQDGRALLRDGKLEEAVAAADDLKARKPEHPGVVAFDAEVQRQVREQQESRDRQIEAARREIERLLEQGFAGEATNRLTNLTSQFPSERVFQELLPRAIAGEQEQKKRQGINAVLSRAGELAGAKRWSQAIAELDKGLATWPNTSDLLQEKSRILRLKATQEGEDDVEGMLSRHEWEAAIQTADSLLAKFPGEARILELREQGRRQLEFERLSREADRLVIQGEIDQAEPMIDELLKRSPGDSNLQRLKQIIQRRRKRDQDFDTAQRLLKGRKFQEAHDLVIKILLEDPEDAAAGDLLKRIERESLEHARKQQIESQEQERRQKIARLLTEADELCKKRQYLKAVQFLERGAREFGNDEDVQEALGRAREALAQSEKKEAIARGRSELASLMKQERFDEANQKALQLASSFPDANFEADAEAAVKAKEVHELRKWVEMKVAEIDKLFRKGDAASVRAQCQEVLTKVEDPRVRQYLAWANSTKPSKFNWRWIAAGAGVLLVMFVVWKLIPPPVPISVGEVSVAPTELSFSSMPGDALIPAQSFQLTGKPADAVWVVKPSDKWFTVSPPEPIGNSKITVNVDPRSLGPGVHTGVVLISGKHVSATAQVAVRLTITLPPPPPMTLQVTPPDLLTFTYRKGSVLPPDQPITLTGNPTIETWVIKTTPAWLTASPKQRKGDGTISIHVDPQNLPLGDQSGLITVSAKTSPVTPVSVQVRLSVLPPEVVPLGAPEPKVQPQTLTFTYRRGGDLPGLKILTLTGKPPGEAWAVSASDPWIKLNPTQLTGDGSISVQVEPQGLGLGDHPGAVIITSKRVPAVKTQAIVRLTIDDAPAPPPPPPPTYPPARSCDRAMGYHGTTEGDVTWKGLLPPGQTVTIARDSTGSENTVAAAPPGPTGAVSGRAIPGCPVSITSLTDGIDTQEPNASNNFAVVIMKNNSPNPIRDPKFHWTVK